MQIIDKQFIYGEKEFIPLIYEGSDGIACNIPAGYNSIAICVDLSLASSLHFTEVNRRVEKALDNHYMIWWKLNLNLEELHLINEAIVQSFILAINCFFETLYRKYENYSIAIEIVELPLQNACLGSNDNSLWEKGLLTSQEDALFLKIHQQTLIIAQFLTHISVELSEKIPLFIRLGSDLFPLSVVKQAFIYTMPSLDPFYLTAPYSLNGLIHLGLHTWQGSLGYIGKNQQRLDLKQDHMSKASIGVLLPQADITSLEPFSRYEEAVSFLQKNHLPFILIPERSLFYFWEGLDRLILDAKYVSRFGKRQITGFLATGGQLADLRDSPEEVEAQSWDKIKYQWTGQ